MRDKDNKGIYISQQSLIKKMIKEFEEDISKLGKYKTPGAPGSKVLRPEDNSRKINEKLQSKYRTGVGSLLYLVKILRPDLCNITRDLSKVLDGATKIHWDALMRALKFVKDTINWKLVLRPNHWDQVKWNMVVYCDSDYSGDKDTRISVTGYIIFLMGAVVCYK